MKPWLRLCLGLSMLAIVLPAETKKPAAAAPAADPKCVDVPRVAVRRAASNPAVKRLALTEAMQKDLANVLFGVTLNDQMQLNFDMQSSTDDGATQLEKMLTVLASAEQMKAEPGEAVVIDLQKNTRVTRNGKLVRTTVSLTDQQLEKLLEARYGRKMIAEVKARMVYVHGMFGGTKSYPWADNLTIDLGR